MIAVVVGVDGVVVGVDGVVVTGEVEVPCAFSGVGRNREGFCYPWHYCYCALLFLLHLSSSVCIRQTAKTIRRLLCNKMKRKYFSIKKKRGWSVRSCYCIVVVVVVMFLFFFLGKAAPGPDMLLISSCMEEYRIRRMKKRLWCFLCLCCCCCSLLVLLL